LVSGPKASLRPQTSVGGRRAPFLSPIDKSSRTLTHVKSWRIFACLAAIALAAYVAAYRFTPKRYSYIGLDLEHARQFGHRWELFFYYPAGWTESLLIRAWPSLYNREVKCPQVVVLVVFEHRSEYESRTYHFRFHSGPVPPPIEQVFPANTDILEYVANKNPQHGKSWPNGLSESDAQTVTCKYYSCALDGAEAFLSSKYPRPWTIEKVLRWYKQATDPETRRHLVYLLGATRDARAALALGESVEDARLNTLEMFETRYAAHQELLNFIPMPKCGEPGDWPQSGLQGRGEGFQEEWFRQNKTRLQAICANSPKIEQ
jgi:hypothetical protein